MYKLTKIRFVHSLIVAKCTIAARLAILILFHVLLNCLLVLFCEITFVTYLYNTKFIVIVSFALFSKLTKSILLQLADTV